MLETLRQNAYPRIKVKFETQLVRYGVGQRNGAARLRRYQPGNLILAHHDTEPPFPIGHHPKLPLVGRTGQVWEIHNDRLESLGLASQSVDATGSLLDCAGIPCEIVMNDMAAESLKIDSLPHDLAANQDVGEKRSVEGSHQAGSGVTPRDTSRHLHIGECDRARISIGAAFFITLHANTAGLRSTRRL